MQSLLCSTIWEISMNFRQRSIFPRTYHKWKFLGYVYSIISTIWSITLLIIKCIQMTFVKYDNNKVHVPIYEYFKLLIRLSLSILQLNIINEWVSSSFCSIFLIDSNSNISTFLFLITLHRKGISFNKLLFNYSQRF